MLITHAVVVIALDIVAVLHGVAGKVKLFKGGFYISVRILVCSFKADRIVNVYGAIKYLRVKMQTIAR